MYYFVCMLHFKTKTMKQQQQQHEKPTKKHHPKPKPQGLPNTILQWSLFSLHPTGAPSVIFAPDNTSF